LGVGVGWLAEEFTVLGADFKHRAGTMDRFLAVLRHLLAPDPASGDVVPPGLEGVVLAPPPATPLPILVGGHAPSALRRAAAFGDGWHGVWLEPEEVPYHLAATRDQSPRPSFRVSLRIDVGLVDGGRVDGDPAEERPGLFGSPDQIAAKLLRYRASGLDELVLDFMDRDHAGVPELGVILEQLHRLHTAVLPVLTD
jgi:alkanesulfonate monooxygenase SsuD/methylene tetrahydromethanopterin reductase-like flavin-dependent oxidoreductase (luciferase family)